MAKCIISREEIENHAYLQRALKPFSIVKSNQKKLVFDLGFWWKKGHNLPILCHETLTTKIGE